ncbi:hypothetical protein PCANC_19698 [Puccinia coronata f. sp. avenae]|uniref:Uncharacterized protein n=1 Tax=Puccinia coronata f. sp. avenae TaxID=200324 RepID=A0A2N5SB17_9BASI|nr:hypothetical protein PCANC_19698 [Puccinia coronata f. sp. avenae]
MSVNEDDPDYASLPSFGAEGTKLICHMNSEATGLVVLCCRSYFICGSALDALQITATARGSIQEASSVTIPRSMTLNPTCSITNLLAEPEERLFDNLNVDNFSSVERTRLVKQKKHRKTANDESLSDLLESDNPADSMLLCFALSLILSNSLVLTATSAPAALTLSLQCGGFRRLLHRQRQRAQSKLGLPQPLHVMVFVPHEHILGTAAYGRQTICIDLGQGPNGPSLGGVGINPPSRGVAVGPQE